MSFRNRLVLTFFCLAIAISGIQFLLLYRASRHSVLEEVRLHLMTLAETASLAVSYEKHEALKDPTQKRSALYKEVSAPLQPLLENWPQIIYLYTLKKIDNRYYFVLDIEAPKKQGPFQEEPEYADIMQEYDDINPETIRAIEQVYLTKKPEAETTLTTDQWGTFISGFAPLTAPNGDIYGVLGVDMRVDELERHLSSFRNSFFLSFGLGVLITIILSTMFSSYLRTILSRFEMAIDYMQRDQHLELPFKNPKDEFGRIAQKFYDMHLLVSSQKRILRDQIAKLEMQTREISDAHANVATALDALKTAQTTLVQSQKLAALGELGAGLAHELNSPLAAALEVSRQLLEEINPDHPDYPLFVELKTACEYMAKIIRSISLFSRQSAADRAPVNIREAIENALILVGHRIKKWNVLLKTEFEEHNPMVWGNLLSLEEALLNLIINACDAMEGLLPDTAVRCLLIEVIPSGTGFPSSHIVIRISDTGPGISPDVRDKIFQPFFTTKPEGKGTGLGLSITYGILKDLGGEISLHSEKTGTRFEIRLPRYRTHSESRST